MHILCSKPLRLAKAYSICATIIRLGKTALNSKCAKHYAHFYKQLSFYNKFHKQFS